MIDFFARNIKRLGMCQSCLIFMSLLNLREEYCCILAVQSFICFQLVSGRVDCLILIVYYCSLDLKFEQDNLPLKSTKLQSRKLNDNL